MRTFAENAARPAVLVPFLVVCLLVGIGSALLRSRIDTEQEVLMGAEMAERFGGKMTEEQIDRQIEAADEGRGVKAGVAAVTPAPIYLFIGLVLWLACKAFGSPATYKGVLSTVLYASTPLVILQLATWPVILSQRAIHPMKAQDLLPSHLGALAGDAPLLYWLLFSLDIFALWSVALYVIGLQQASRLSRAKAAGIVITLWLVGILLRAVVMGSLLQAVPPR